MAIIAAVVRSDRRGCVQSAAPCTSGGAVSTGLLRLRLIDPDGKCLFATLQLDHKRIYARDHSGNAIRVVVMLMPC